MSRFILLLFAIVMALSPASWGQCVISKDSFGQIITTCEAHLAELPDRIPTYTHKQTNYLGNEYFSYPAWQRGTVQLDQLGKEVACLVAYNVVENKVMCQFASEVTSASIKPYAFTINGIKFMKQTSRVLGIEYQAYGTVLRDGQTKLLKSLTRRLVNKPIHNSYEKSSVFDGYYQTEERYYIRRGDRDAQLTSLSRSSLLAIVYEQADQIASHFPQKQLTINEVIKLLTYHDSLTTVSNIDKPPLSRDAAFTGFLHDQIKYPNRAWNSGVYGRVYAGFDVNTSGQLTNVTLLSPDNIGFDFDQTVIKALVKVATVNSIHAGHYILPVSFTYTNTLDKEPTHVPINTLAPERIEGRTVLPEFIVPITVSKPVIETREVWGFYKK